MKQNGFFYSLTNETPMSLGLTVMFVLGGIHLMSTIKENQVLIKEQQKHVLGNAQRIAKLEESLRAIASNQELIRKNTVDIEKLQKVRLEIDTRIFDQLNDIKKDLNQIQGYLKAQREKRH